MLFWGVFMFIDCFENNGGKYLRVVRSIRTTKKDGRKTTKKIPVFNIGPLSKFDDGEPDYVVGIFYYALSCLKPA